MISKNSILLLPLCAQVLCAVPSTAIEDVTGKSGIVGINYSSWHTLGYKGKPNETPRNIQKILAEGQAKPEAFGPEGSWHFWAEPAVGYYTGNDTMVMNYHFELLEAARIDYIVLDATNVVPGSDYKQEYLYDPLDKMLDLIKWRSKRGLDSPKIILWSPWELAVELYEHYYSKPAHASAWLYLNDGQGPKPMYVTTQEFERVSPEIKRALTIRRMWGLKNKMADGEWSFLSKHPQPVCLGPEKRPEQVVVCVAHQAEYMSNEKTATPRAQGRTFQKQWSRAFEIRPQFVTITWWNELMAQRQKDGSGGRIQFVDMYKPEFSRDIEPVKAPYGDMYYRFMRDYIHAYKEGKPMPQNLLEELDKGSDRPDFDMDGIPNQVEGDKDSDGDGIPDQWDLDSNQDGKPDFAGDKIIETNR